MEDLPQNQRARLAASVLVEDGQAKILFPQNNMPWIWTQYKPRSVFLAILGKAIIMAKLAPTPLDQDAAGFSTAVDAETYDKTVNDDTQGLHDLLTQVEELYHRHRGYFPEETKAVAFFGRRSGRIVWPSKVSMARERLSTMGVHLMIRTYDLGAWHEEQELLHAMFVNALYNYPSCTVLTVELEEVYQVDFAVDEILLQSTMHRLRMFINRGLSREDAMNFVATAGGRHQGLPLGWEREFVKYADQQLHPISPAPSTRA